PVGVALCWREGEACYIPVGHRYLGKPTQLKSEKVLEQLRPLLEDLSFPKYGQNHKYDWLVLKRAGVDMQGVVCDPMLASYVLDPSRNRHGLDDLALENLGHTMLSFKSVTGRDGHFDEVDVSEATRYAAEDAEATFKLVKLLGAALEKEPDLSDLCRNVELPLSRILAEMELRGCGLDVPWLQELSHSLESQIREIEEGIWKEAGWEVNINSPKQLQTLLFEQLNLTPGRKTKTGFSTDSDVLADLAVEHPIAAQIDEYRTLSKLKSTYSDALPVLFNKETGRLHTSYNQAVTATGRLSSSDPNLQNIPVRTEIGRQIRKAFVAPKGRLLLSADYSQIELRILAHLSKDPVLIDAFCRGQDIHARTAMEVFGASEKKLTDEQRRVAKAVNFGVIYGQTDWGLARQLRIPKHKAKQYIDGYFQRYAGVKEFMEKTINDARSSGMVRTLLGRRRPIPDINSQKSAARLYAERIARNTPIQGTAADLIKLAMIRVEHTIKERRLDAPMILTVHDELIFEVLPNQVDKVKKLVSEVMENVIQLDVPLRIDIGVGENWAEAH
ncbi:MAG: DNA polymerase I, partial [Pseudomonadota bacterium]